MNFKSPQYLFFLLGLLPILVLYIYTKKRRNLFLTEINKAADGKSILDKNSDLIKVRRRLKYVSFLIGYFFLILSLAGPRWGVTETVVEKLGIDIVVALDLSKSMLTEDISPSRMERAKMELASFIDSRQGDRIAITGFAGSAFLACPLTTDYSAAKSFLYNLSPDIISAPGTALAHAIDLSADLLKEGQGREKIIVLLTDGEETIGDPLRAAGEAKEKGIMLYTIGFGTKAGGPIPVYDRNRKIIDYKKDKQGKIVVSKLDGSFLKNLADKGGGIFFYGADSVRQLAGEIEKKDKQLISSRLFTLMEERFQYPLIIALIFLSIDMLLLERRKLL